MYTPENAALDGAKFVNGEYVLFFHIDESGNTGKNLLDRNQPRFSYGMISSSLNVDAIGIRLHKKMLQDLGVRELHANQLKLNGLTKIAPP